MSNAETTLGEIFAPADIQLNGDRPWDMQIRNDRCAARILAEGSLGLGESYMDGWWECEQLDVFFARLTSIPIASRIREPKQWWMWIRSWLFNLQSPHRSRKVADEHYNLGNAFYQAMLDPLMQYTCAYWKDVDNLADAQRAKLDLVCRKLQLQKGERVLEFGGGWGGFARYAAEHYGVEVVSYNISSQQVAFARELCAGYPVEVRQADYRTAEGRYDKVVSIGICEHIGSKNHRSFLEIQRRCVKDDGLILLHTIGCRFTKITSDPWFTRYIFANGHLPSLKQLTEAMERILVAEDMHNIGACYDPTLMAWNDNFEASWDAFKDQYGERFRRMWRYYLLSCAGAFRSRDIQLWQWVMSPRGVSGGYQSVR